MIMGNIETEGQEKCIDWINRYFLIDYLKIKITGKNSVEITDIDGGYATIYWDEESEQIRSKELGV